MDNEMPTYHLEDEIIYAKNIWGSYIFAIERDDPKEYIKLNNYLYGRKFSNANEGENDIDVGDEEETKLIIEDEDDEYDKEDRGDWHIEMNCTLEEIMTEADYDYIELRKQYFKEFRNKKYNSHQADEEFPEIPQEEIDQFVKFLKSYLD